MNENLDNLPKEKPKNRLSMDLTKGKPIKMIMLFMLPLLIGNIFQQLYSMADTIIVGRTLGSAALSGVGSTGALSFLILGFAQGLSSGFAVITSQRYGANDTDGVRRSIATSITLTLAINAVLTIIATSCALPLLKLMNTKAEFIDYAYQYIFVIFAGMLLNAFYNQFAQSLRAIGDSTAPLIFLIIACLVNIGLDFALIVGAKMGVRGAAVATLASQGFSALLTFIYMQVKYKALRLSLKDFKIDIKLWGVHIKLGLPMALQFSIISIGMIMNQTALNNLAPSMVTAYVAATKIDNIACAVIMTTGTAVGTFVGQNYGAEKYDRIKTGVRQSLIVSTAISIVLGVLLITLSTPFTKLFIDVKDQTPELFAHAKTYLIYNGAFYWLLGALAIYRSALQGMGHGLIILIAAAVEVVMRVSFALISIYAVKNVDMAFIFVCCANMMSWFGSDIILMPDYFLTLKKIRKSQIVPDTDTNANIAENLSHVPASPASSIRLAPSATATSASNAISNRLIPTIENADIDETNTDKTADADNTDENLPPL